MKETLYNKLGEDFDLIDSSEFGNVYFGEDGNWLSHKLAERTHRGESVEPLNEKEKEIFKGALVDMADKIRRMADKI